MTTPSDVEPLEQRIAVLERRIAALESTAQLALQRDRSQDASLQTLLSERDSAVQEKMVAESRAQRVSQILKRLERLVMVTGICMIALFIVHLNERGGDPDPVLRRWALLACGGSSVLVITGNANAIGIAANRFLGSTHGRK